MFRTIVSLAIGIGTLCSAAAWADESTAVKKIRDLLEAKRLNRSVFPKDAFDPASFDPREYDPAMLEAAWEEVRSPVIRILNQELSMQLSEQYALSLWVLQVSAASSITADGQITVTRKFKVVFRVSEPAKNALMKALELPAECFPNIMSEKRTEAYNLDDLSARFRAYGRPDWREIGAATTQFMSESRRVRELQFRSTEPNYSSNAVQVVSNWRVFHQSNDYDFLWRLFFQVKQSDSDDQVLVSGRTQFARNWPNAPLERLQYLGSDEDDDRYEDMLNASLGQGRGFRVVTVFLDGDSCSPVNLERPLAVSTCNAVIHDVMTAYVKLLKSG